MTPAPRVRRARHGGASRPPGSSPGSTGARPRRPAGFRPRCPARCSWTGRAPAGCRTRPSARTCASTTGWRTTTGSTAPACPQAALAPGERARVRVRGRRLRVRGARRGRARAPPRGAVHPVRDRPRGCPPGAEIEVLVLPAPKRPGAPRGRRRRPSHVCKPAVSYGWDWHPRLIPLGLWAGAGFVARPKAHLGHVDFAYTLSEDLSEAADHGRGRGRGRRRAAELAAPGRAGRDRRRRRLGPAAFLRGPSLWWTHDHGEPALYTLEVTSGADTLPGQGRASGACAWSCPRAAGGTPAGFPKSRSHPPDDRRAQRPGHLRQGVQLGERRTSSPARISAETLRPLLRLARERQLQPAALLGRRDRQPGGVLRAVRRARPARLAGVPARLQPLPGRPGLPARPRPGVALHHPPAAPAPVPRPLVRGQRALQRVVGDDGPVPAAPAAQPQLLRPRPGARPSCPPRRSTAWATATTGSATSGAARCSRSSSGPRNTAYPNSAARGPSPAPYLRTFIPEAELWPPRPGTSWQTHHGFGAWRPTRPRGSARRRSSTTSGPPATWRRLVERGAWLQGVGCRAAFEEARRQKPACAMALNWCFNEPWPSAAGTCIVNWPALPKPAYDAVRLACRPVLASARLAQVPVAGRRGLLRGDLAAQRLAGRPGGGRDGGDAHGGRAARRASSLGVPRRSPPGRNLAGPSVQAALPSVAGGGLRAGPEGFAQARSGARSTA